MSRIIDVDNLPDPSDLVACAEFKAKNQDAIGAVYSWNGRVAKALRAEIEATHQPIGGMTLVRAGGWEYSVRIADEMPQFGRNRFTFTLPCELEHTRVLEILLEAMPEHETEIRSEYKITTEVDKEMVKGWIAAHREGMITERLRELCTSKTELGVLP